MKICDIAQSYTQSSGGIKTYIQAKRDLIVEQGEWEHVLIIPGERDGLSVEGPLRTYTITSQRVPGCHPYRFSFRLDKVHRILAREMPDLVELASPYWLPWAAFHHRHRHECGVVGFYHADFPRTYVESTVRRALGRSAGRFARRRAERYARLLYNRCDLTLTASSQFETALQGHGVKRVRLVPLGVDLETFSPTRRDPGVWTEHGLPDARHVLIYSGRMDREKDVMVLVRAVRRFAPERGLRLVMVGEGPLRRELEHLARTDPRIVILPYQRDRIGLATLMASADMYLTAGPHETFGLSVIEAQACGLPVIGVDAGALQDRVRPGLGHLGPVGDDAAFAANISRCLEEGSAGMGRRAADHVAAAFGWRNAFDEIFDLYRQVAASPMGSRVAHLRERELPALSCRYGSSG